MPSRTEPQRPGSHGSTTTSGTGSAATRSSSSARTGWPAPSATSTPPKTHPGRCCWRPRTTCSACSPPFPSPTASEPPSMTARPRSTNSSASWPTPRRRQGPRPASWGTTPQGRRSCKSSPGRPPYSALPGDNVLVIRDAAALHAQQAGHGPSGWEPFAVPAPSPADGRHRAHPGLPAWHQFPAAPWSAPPPWRRAGQ